MANAEKEQTWPYWLVIYAEGEGHFTLLSFPSDGRAVVFNNLTDAEFAAHEFANGRSFRLFCWRT